MTRIAIIATALCVASQASAQGTLGPSNLAAIDQNGDGTVTRAEYDAFTTSAFQTLDADSDGSLGAQEIEAHLSGASIAELDANGDGIASRDEFAQRMAADFAAADQDGDGVLE